MSNTLLMLAVLPGILIIIYIYRKDKVEKEPWSLIFKLMFFGALSCVPASVMEMFVDSRMPYFPEGSLAYALTMAFCSAAFCEELCKFAFLRIGTWKSPEFGYRFDGIVYGVAVAVGFAVLENILYVYQYGFETAIVRAFMSVPLHAFCGLFMGAFYGAAKQAQIQGKSTGRFIFLALFVPMMIHGVYDTLAFLGNTAASGVLLGFVVLMYIVSIRCVRQYSKDDWQTGFYPEGQPLSGDQGYGGRGQTGGWGYPGGQGQPGQGYGQNRDPFRDMGQDSYRDIFGGSGNPAGQGSGYGRGPQTDHRRRPDAGTGYRAYPGQVQDGKIVLLCPHCRRGLRVPVGLGQIRVRCPHCGQEFTKTT